MRLVNHTAADPLTYSATVTGGSHDAPAGVAPRDGASSVGGPRVGAPSVGATRVGAQRDLVTLPKAHLHLHFPGSMRHATLIDLADQHGIRLPTSLRSEWPPRLSTADERGWFRFQRLYDLARSVLRTESDVRRLIHEAVADDAAEGSGWLEIQVDPSGYGSQFGGITAFTDLVLNAVDDAARHSGIGVGVIIAANRTRHPLDARTLARLARQYVGRGVVGFGLSNDERRGDTEAFGPARSEE